jgi:hypothetical protein
MKIKKIESDLKKKIEILKGIDIEFIDTELLSNAHILILKKEIDELSKIILDYRQRVRLEKLKKLGLI